MDGKSRRISGNGDEVVRGMEIREEEGVAGCETGRRGRERGVRGGRGGGWV